MGYSIAGLLSDLPEEPVMALAKMVERVWQLNEELNGNLSEVDFRTAVIVIQQYAKAHEIEVDNTSGPNWATKFKYVERDVGRLVEPFEIALAEREAEIEVEKLLAVKGASVGIAMLTPDEKRDISAKIEAIREHVEASELQLRKKNRLFACLAKLQKEVMSDGTPMDTLYIVMGELAFNAGVMAKNAKPALKEVKEIARIVTYNRAKKEGVSLPKPGDFLRLTDLNND